MPKRTKRLTSQGEEQDEIRINKFLSEAGVCSRREADRYIEEGKVKIDGEVARMGSKVTKNSQVTFCGKPVKKEEKLVLIAFNKPEGIVCTTDPNEPDNIIDYISYGMRIFPIGRLDKDSEGLILLTNDGNIVNKILRAENYHEKEYIVTVNKEITVEFIKKMSGGIPILDTVTNPCEVNQIDRFTFSIILTQGLNRQIRRMCEYCGYRVTNLRRIRIMNIQLGRLKTGDYRNVTETEIEGLNYQIKQRKSQTLNKVSHINIKENQGIDKESQYQDKENKDWYKESQGRDKGNQAREKGTQGREKGAQSRDKGTIGRDRGNQSQDKGNQGKAKGTQGRDKRNQGLEKGNQDRTKENSTRDTGSRAQYKGSKVRNTGNQAKDKRSQGRYRGNK